MMLSSLVIVTSCRGESSAILNEGGTVAVNVNLIGTEFVESPVSSGKASLKQKGLSGNSRSSHSVLVNPSTQLLVEFNHVSENRAPLFQASTAKISGENLPLGTMFRVIAYRQSSGDYQTHQDYTVGQLAIPLALDNGVAYDMVTYSYGSTSLPSISQVETSNLNNAVVNYDDDNRDFMYQKQSFTPQNPNNILNIILAHKLAQITTIFDLRGDGSIEAINTPILSSHYTTGEIPLNSGNIKNRTGAATSLEVVFPGPYPNKTQSSVPLLVNADTEGVASGSFSANITIHGTSSEVNLPNAFSITPGRKQNLIIKFSKCGAYVGPGVWKDFMCHNLGADTNADPFTPSASIHGAKYQWGAQTGESGRYVSQDEDLNIIEPILGWNTTPTDSNSWSEVKTANDPCPSGYKVPSASEWNAVLVNNSTNYIGSNWTESITNYENGLMIGDGLFLPAAGMRGPAGEPYTRGLNGDYWTSTSYLNRGAYFMTFTVPDSRVSPNFIPTLGLSVRCISE